MVYVLELEGGNYYVGWTSVESTSDRQLMSVGAAWPSLHHPIGVLKRLHGADKAQQKEVTLDFMRLYGWEKVRGYAWSQCEMKQPPIPLQV